MSDLSRRFNADILIDLSAEEDAYSENLDLADVDSAINLVPLDRGFGTVYSDLVLNRANLVA